MKSKDNRALLSVIFSQWLSLSTCVIQSAIDIVPPPSTAQLTRIPKILYPDLLEPTIEPKNKLEKDLFSCNSSSDAFITAYVSKMFAVPTNELPENKKRQITAEEMRAGARDAKERLNADTSTDTGTPDLNKASEGSPQETIKDESEDTILGFARIYSGTICVGAKISCVLPKFNDKLPSSHPRNIPYFLTTTVEGLYTMMGRELVPVESVPAGNVFAIKGLEGKVMRSATIFSPGESVIDDSKMIDYIPNLGGVLHLVSQVYLPMHLLIKV
jgi:ribosome assembly protein 1